MSFAPGTRVQTPLGPGRVATVQNARDSARGYGTLIRGSGWVVVALERGGRRVYRTRDLREGDA